MQIRNSQVQLGWNDNYIDEISNDAGRTLMGSHQENWFYNSLSRSAERGAVWRIIGNQIVFSRVNVSSWFGTFENPYNSDQWDVRFPLNPYQDCADVLRRRVTCRTGTGHTNISTKTILEIM